MSLIPTTIISAQTDAVTSAEKFEAQQRFVPSTVMATNLAGAESVAVLFSVDDGVTFEPLSQDGSDLTLTATANTFAITAPGLFGFTKSATVAASGVFVMQNQQAKSA